MRRALLAIVAIFWAVPAFAQVPSSKVVAWDEYRLNIDFNNVQVDSTIRFPKRSTLSNNLVDEQSANQVNRQKVQWVHPTLVSGTTDVQLVVWSGAIPAGKDTVRITQSVRTFSFGGCDIDSMRYLNPGATVILQIYCTDGH